MRVKKGIDISSYNVMIDYAKVASQIDYAILRAGFTGHRTGASLYKDKGFELHYENFTQQKIPLGAYYYSCADTADDARLEADFLIKLLSGKQFAYPIYIDVEDNFHQKKLSKAELSEVVKTFADRLEKAGYYVGVYANTYWWKNELDLDALKHLDRWVAHYGVNTPGVQGEMWQYTETGKLVGYPGVLDLNYCYKDYPTIIQTAGLNGFAAPAKPAEIMIKGVITGDDGTHKIDAIKRLMVILGFGSIEVT